MKEKVQKLINQLVGNGSPQQKPSTTSAPLKTENRVYSNRQSAIDAAMPYSNYVKADVYVYESKYGSGDSQFTLRTRNQIFSPDSDCVIHHETYISIIPKQDIPPTKE